MANKIVEDLRFRLPLSVAHWEALEETARFWREMTDEGLEEYCRPTEFYPGTDIPLARHTPHSLQSERDITQRNVEAHLRWRRDAEELIALYDSANAKEPKP